MGQLVILLQQIQEYRVQDALLGDISDTAYDISVFVPLTKTRRFTESNIHTKWGNTPPLWDNGIGMKAYNYYKGGKNCYQ